MLMASRSFIGPSLSNTVSSASPSKYSMINQNTSGFLERSKSVNLTTLSCWTLADTCPSRLSRLNSASVKPSGEDGRQSFIATFRSGLPSFISCAFSTRPKAPRPSSSSTTYRDLKPSGRTSSSIRASSIAVGTVFCSESALRASAALYSAFSGTGSGSAGVGFTSLHNAVKIQPVAVFDSVMEMEHWNIAPSLRCAGTGPPIAQPRFSPVFM
mmetsp:Transcript_22992/g.53713  ORF Transcript_22992/g.53713 Transcript_22992/m.53713 type:complete len:213 (+) Transcript_22992:1400-2038(+)